MFSAFPYEVEETIYFWVANVDCCSPPGDLLACAQTCTNALDIIFGTHATPHHSLLARIFRYRFDKAAPRRRLGPITNRDFADELKTRCPALRRVAAGVIHGEHIVQDLWVVQLMLLEDDGKNRNQLAHLGVERWIRSIILSRSYEANDLHGWPLETEVIQLAASVFSMVSTRASASAESEREREEILHRMQPFMFGAHRYPISHLPATQHVVCSTRRLPPANVHTMLTMASSPVYRPSTITHFGRCITLSRPLAATSAILVTYLYSERDDIRYRRDIPATRAHALEVGWRGAVQEDWQEANLVRREGLGIEIHGSCSRMWDADWARLVLTHMALDPDPKMDRQLAECWFAALWEPGTLSGKWVGRYIMPNYIGYTRMLAMHPHPLRVVDASLVDDERAEYYLPMQLHLREHISTDLGNHVSTAGPATGDGVQNGWFPKELELGRPRGGMRETVTELVIHDPREPDEQWATKRYATWHPGMALPTANPPPAFPRVSVPSSSESQPQPQPQPEVPEDIEMEFAREGMPRDDPEDEDMECPTSVDVIITGETDYAHGAAWGHYIVYGRVRRNDGLVVLVRAPQNPEYGQGRWIFRGYVRAGCTIVGRWRETGTSMDAVAYEGSFVLCKVDETFGCR